MIIKPYGMAFAKQEIDLMIYKKTYKTLIVIGSDDEL